MIRLTVAVCSIFLPLSGAVRAGANGDVVGVTFERCGGMICVPVTLADGRSHVLLLDTGNVNSWLVADTARILGLKLIPIEQDGQAVAGIFRLGVQSVSLQGQPLSGTFLAGDRKQAGELPPGVEGALAYTLFKDRVLQIDYPHLTLRVLGPRHADTSRSAGELKLITFGKKGPPIVVGSGFSVNGKSVSAQIDTCFTGTFVVYDAAAGALGLRSAAARGRPKYFPYTDGGVNMQEAPAEKVAFGAYVLLRPPARVYFPGTGDNPVHQPDGLFEATAGNALFVHSVVTLDFRAMRIDVRPG